MRYSLVSLVPDWSLEELLCRPKRINPDLVRLRMHPGGAKGKARKRGGVPIIFDFPTEYELMVLVN
jgi:hypothetical protein